MQGSCQRSIQWISRGVGPFKDLRAAGVHVLTTSVERRAVEIEHAAQVEIIGSSMIPTESGSDLFQTTDVGEVRQERLQLASTHWQLARLTHRKLAGSL